MKIKKIYDISRKVNDKTTVWPGDPSNSFKKISSVDDGDDVTLHRAKIGMHAGTHVDAPMHFVAGGAGIYDVDLKRFLGMAKVFKIKSEKNISLGDIEKLEINKDDIILFKTQNSLSDDEGPFQEDFIYLDYKAAQYLVHKKVACVGIDYLSIENFFSESHQTHKVLLSSKIGILENINLKDVPEGEYFLSCLPLKFEGVEASPVRAVLIEFY